MAKNEKAIAQGYTTNIEETYLTFQPLRYEIGAYGSTAIKDESVVILLHKGMKFVPELALSGEAYEPLVKRWGDEGYLKDGKKVKLTAAELHDFLRKKAADYSQGACLWEDRQRPAKEAALEKKVDLLLREAETKDEEIASLRALLGKSNVKV